MVYASRLVCKINKRWFSHIWFRASLCPFCCLHHSCSSIGWLYSDHGHIGNLAKGRLNQEQVVWIWINILGAPNQYVHIQAILAAAAVKSLRSCPTLCDPIDGSPPGSTIPGILQARTLEWVAISFSSARKWKVKVKSLSCVRLVATPWTAAYQAPPSMGFSKQEYWSGVPLPSPQVISSCPVLK